MPGPAGSMPRLATLVYVVRDGEVLMLERAKEPNRGLWVAPGGKVSPGESPAACALRELREETGLVAAHAELRGLMTEVSPRDDYQWLLFVYRVRDAVGPLVTEPGIGVLRWFPLDEVPGLALPPADAIFYPHVIGDGPPFSATFRYDEQLALVGWERC